MNGGSYCSSCKIVNLQVDPLTSLNARLRESVFPSFALFEFIKFGSCWWLPIHFARTPPRPLPLGIPKSPATAAPPCQEEPSKPPTSSKVKNQKALPRCGDTLPLLRDSQGLGPGYPKEMHQEWVGETCSDEFIMCFIGFARFR